MNELLFYDENRTVFPDIWYQFDSSNLKNYGLKGEKYDIDNYQNDAINLPVNDLLYEIMLNSEEFIIAFRSKHQNFVNNNIISFKSDGNDIIILNVPLVSTNTVEFKIGNGTTNYNITQEPTNIPNWSEYNNYKISLEKIDGTNQKKMKVTINGELLNELVIYDFTFLNVGTTTELKIGSSSIRFKDLRIYLNYFDDNNVLHNVYNTIFDNNYGNLIGDKVELIENYYNFSNLESYIELPTTIKDGMNIENGFTILYEKRYNDFVIEQCDFYMNSNFVSIKTYDEKIKFDVLNYSLETVTGLYDGIWYNLGFSVKLDITDLTLTIWMDGYSLASKTYKNVSINDPTTLTTSIIGSDNILTGDANYDIRDFRIFKTELSKKEILDIFIGKEKLLKKEDYDVNSINKWMIPNFNLKIDNEKLINQKNFTGKLSNYVYEYPDLINVSEKYPSYIEHEKDLINWYKFESNLNSETDSNLNGKEIGNVIYNKNTIELGNGYIELSNVDKEYLLKLENTFGISYWNKLNTSNISVDNSILITTSYLQEITLSNVIITSNYVNNVEVLESNIILSNINVTCNIELLKVKVDSYNVEFTVTDNIGYEKSEIKVQNTWDNEWHNWCFNLTDDFKINIYKDGELIGEKMNSRLSKNYTNLNDISVSFGKESSDVLMKDYRVYNRSLSYVEIQQNIEHITGYPNHINDLILMYKFKEDEKIKNVIEENKYDAVKYGNINRIDGFINKNGYVWNSSNSYLEIEDMTELTPKLEDGFSIMFWKKITNVESNIITFEKNGETLLDIDMNMNDIRYDIKTDLKYIINSK